MRAPRNLRVVFDDPDGRGRFCDVRFDGDDHHNGYVLYVRPCSDLPREDDPFGRPVFVANPDGGKWSPAHKGWTKDADGNRIWGSYRTEGVRRTWTQYGGHEPAVSDGKIVAGRSRTQADTPIPVVASDLDGDGPWQLVAVDNAKTHADPPDEMYSNMIVWPAPPPPPPPPVAGTRGERRRARRAARRRADRRARRRARRGQ